MKWKKSHLFGNCDQSSDLPVLRDKKCIEMKHLKIFVPSCFYASAADCDDDREFILRYFLCWIWIYFTLCQ